MTHAQSYKTKFVAFIDLLGFTYLVDQSALEAKRQRRVASAISILQETACTNDQHDIFLTGFSDSLVISSDVTAAGLDCMLRMIGQIARNLLQDDILIRGGVSVGAIHHEGTMTFGPAMNEAYAIENSWAVYPAVILSSDVAAKAEEFEASCVCADPHRPHLLMLDYLKPYRTYEPDLEAKFKKISLDDPAKLIASHIQNRLIQHQSNQSLHSKAKWLEAYWNSTVSVMGVLPTTKDTIEFINPHPIHESTRFVTLGEQKVEVWIEGPSYAKK